MGVIHMKQEQRSEENEQQVVGWFHADVLGGERMQTTCIAGKSFGQFTYRTLFFKWVFEISPCCGATGVWTA